MAGFTNAHGAPSRNRRMRVGISFRVPSFFSSTRFESTCKRHLSLAEVIQALACSSFVESRDFMGRHHNYTMSRHAGQSRLA